MYFGEQKINILIVDDNPRNLLALEAILQSPERNLVRAASGKEALRYLLDQDAAVILLDVYMPELDGLETAALIRGRHKSRDIPIIFLTADSAGISQLQHAYSLGAVDFILKPIEPEILKSKIAVFVELYKKTSQVKRQAELLRERNLELENENLSRLSAIVELGQDLASERDPTQLLEKFCHAARSIVSTQLAAVLTVDDKDKTSIPEMIVSRASGEDASHDTESNSSNEVNEKHRTIENVLVQQRDPLRLTSMATRALHLGALVGTRAQRSMLCAPIFTPQKHHGWLLLVDKRDDVEPSELTEFSEADERLAVTLAAQVAITYENAKLYTEARVLTSELRQEVAERRQAEEARAELLVREQAARQEAEAANRMKDQFLATLSHELRTPLTAILGWTQLMRAGGLDQAGATRALDTIQRNARAQSQLIDDLLDVSRIITGKLRLNMVRVELKPIIEAALDSIKPSAAANKIELITHLDDFRETVSGDAHRLQQIAWNLLSNAVKFTPGGGRIEVRLERQNDSVMFVVKDTGQGIPAEFMPIIFDRFRQVDGTTTRLHGGLGLGLAIVRHLVELHGGIIEAHSDGVEQGATFTVSLPLTQRREVETAEVADEVAEFKDALGLTGLLENLRVLVVEDERDTREMIVAVLSHCGADVRDAGSVAEAFEFVTTWMPDVLVSDIGMPDEDGYSLMRRIQELNLNGIALPALALTAYASLEDRARALAAGFQMHTSKPIEPVELVAIVASLAGRFERVS